MTQVLWITDVTGSGGLVSVALRVAEWVESAGELTEAGAVLVAAAQVLAAEIDCPPTTADGSPKSVAGSVSALQRVLAELEARGRKSTDAGMSDWASFAVSAGATPIRDAAGSVEADVRARGRRGRAPAG